MAGGTPLSLIDHATRQIEAGWVFYWNSTQYLETEDPRHSLIGQGPLIVLDDGAILEGGSGQSVEDVLNLHGLLGRPHFTATVEWSPWKGSKHSAGGSAYSAFATVPGREKRIPVNMQRTSEAGVWSIAFAVDPPHGDITFDTEVTLFEGSKEAGRAILRGWIPQR
jgi:hypothetical protein